MALTIGKLQLKGVVSFKKCYHLSQWSFTVPRRLTNLVELDLSENLLREVPSEAWRHTSALMRLNLGANPIKLIRSGAFQQLKVGRWSIYFVH